MSWRSAARGVSGTRGIEVVVVFAAVALGVGVSMGAAEAAGAVGAAGAAGAGEGVSAAGAAGAAGADGAAGAARERPLGGGSGTAVVYQVSAAGQRAALSYWTPARMAAAVPADLPRGAAGPAISAPKGIPTAVHFSGVPTVGALFYTTGSKQHFCTASVVDSTVGDLVLTAAHCVDGDGFATNIEYVPEYHEGQQPYGAFAVRTITVAAGWQKSHDPDLDFAFLDVDPPKGRKVQAVTGGLTLGFSRWYRENIEVIGYNDADSKPIRCATKSFKFRTGQMEFYCHDFWSGTSGGPWIIGYNARRGTGTVFGVIGGYEQGGDYDWASYSAYFGSALRGLFAKAERVPAPTST